MTSIGAICPVVIRFSILKMPKDACLRGIMELANTRLVRGIVCFVANGAVFLLAAFNAFRQFSSDDDLGRFSLIGCMLFSALGVMSAYGMMTAAEGKRFGAFELASTLSFTAAVLALSSRVWLALLS